MNGQSSSPMEISNALQCIHAVEEIPPMSLMDPDVRRELANYMQPVCEFFEQQSGMVIQNTDGLEAITINCATIKKVQGLLEKYRKEVVAPLNEKVNTINEFFREFSVPLKSSDTTMRKEIGRYQMEQERAERLERERLEQERMDAERRRLEMERKDVPLSDATIAAEQADFDQQEAAIVAPTKTTVFEKAKVTVAKRWTFRVDNEFLVPRDYWTLDERKIQKAVNVGVRTIRGVTIYEEAQPRIQ
uniref:Uncharacterized protein n=1 Tax=viral metagenome TaxID=1070528 RepID=A0A6M3KWG2_9ZZZZ